jgi:phosphoglycerol transferase MdoB-like AlkP superfamily enzyme
MGNYRQHLILFVKRFVFLLLFYFISRLFFYILNNNYFNNITFLVLLKSFIAGIRFDIAAIVYTNIYLVLFLIPGTYKNNRHLNRIVEILFFSINAIALASNFIDVKFFDFINKRSTSALFNLLGTNQDVWLLIPKFVRDYWYVFLTYFLALFLFWKYMPRLDYSKLVTERITIKKLFYQTGLFILVTGAMLLGARGTGLKPISVVNAASYVELKYVPLVLNTPFSILKTVENENLNELNYYDPDSLLAMYNPIHNPDTSKVFRKMNVVIFILEGFSKEYCGFLGGMKGYTPNLDSLLAKSLVFPNAFANGTQSYEAMAAIIAGIPSLMARPYSGSNYADNYIESLPYLLRLQGYHTSFFHGGNNGTMGFSKFAGIAGIEKYYGRNEYNNEIDYDGYWGIWDEPYLQYFSKQLDKFAQPFISTVYTLSSHHPYNVPKQYEDIFKGGELPILKSIAYTDHALGSFFKTAVGKKWFSNTLFVITADHAAQTIHHNTTERLAIPLAFYCPQHKVISGIDSAYCQQIDIMPSVLDYLGYPYSYFAFGESLFEPLSSERSISYVDGIYQLIENGYVMQFDGAKVTSFYQIESENNDNSNKSSIRPVADGQQIYALMEKKLKAILQTYNHSLISNSNALK